MPNISSKVSMMNYLTDLIIGMWGRRVQGPMTHELRAMSYVCTGGLLSAWAGPVQNHGFQPPPRAQKEYDQTQEHCPIRKLMQVSKGVHHS